MEKSEKEAVVRAYLKAVSEGDTDAIAALYADDGTVEDPVGSEVHRGIDAIRAFYKGVEAMQLKTELTGAVRCAGDSVAFPFKVTTSSISMDVIDVFDFDDQGKIATMKAYWGR